MTDERQRELERVAVTLAAPIRSAFRAHLDEHGCGSGNYEDPRYVGGFIHCPVAAELWYALPAAEQITFA